MHILGLEVDSYLECQENKTFRNNSNHINAIWGKSHFLPKWWKWSLLVGIFLPLSYLFIHSFIHSFNKHVLSASYFQLFCSVGLGNVKMRYGVHSFNKYLWRSYYVSETVLGARDIVVKNRQTGASLVAQWLRIHLSMKGTWVRALVGEDPTCRGATKPVRHNYRACALEPVNHSYWSPRA